MINIKPLPFDVQQAVNQAVYAELQLNGATNPPDLGAAVKDVIGDIGRQSAGKRAE